MNSSRTTELADLLEELAGLHVLADENPFKTRAFEKAAATLRELGPRAFDFQSLAQAGKLTDIPGVGKGIAEVLREFLIDGKCSLRAELEAKIPAGVQQLSRVPGLGAKKARLVVEELGITTLAELEYACRENRLRDIKGFSDKSQVKILEAVVYLRAGQGKLRLDEIDHWVEEIQASMEVKKEQLQWRVAGEAARRSEVCSGLDLIVQGSAAQVAPWAAELKSKHPQVRIHGVDHSGASDLLWKEITAPARPAAELRLASGENAIDVLPADLWDSNFSGFKSSDQKSLITRDQIQGAFHMHSTRSDGRNSLEEMVIEAKRLGLKYIGISDHSQTSFYARGLKSDQLKEQEKEVREVQDRHPEIRIFWGIESDILADGSLDYTDAELKRFDFVIASVHSRFQMDAETMTNRLLEAVRNPHTTFLGHSTGRLLLGRPAYACDLEKVIRAAAEVGTAVEMNCNPQRMDLDWRFGPLLRETGCLTSTNPDAHDTAGLSDLRYGVDLARKALVPARQVVTTWDVKQVEKWLISD